MAILPISDQYKYSKRGPLDAKALVKTYAELLNPSTWTIDGTMAAYNGMTTTVWLNSDDTSKNGIYLLHDPTVTSALKVPDVSNEANWHRLAEASELADLADRPIALRRDNDYNYKKIESTFIPANGEVCLVDVAGYGLRTKVGDGISTFAELPYTDEAILQNINSLVIKGYYYQEKFYSDSTHTVLLADVVGRIYIDAASSKLYTYNGIKYEVQTNSLPNATAEIAGVMKLYDQLGQNIDGTVTQRAITDELNKKFEMAVIEEEEIVVFDIDVN